MDEQHDDRRRAPRPRRFSQGCARGEGAGSPSYGITSVLSVLRQRVSLEHNDRRWPRTRTYTILPLTVQLIAVVFRWLCSRVQILSSFYARQKESLTSDLNDFHQARCVQKRQNMVFVRFTKGKKLLYFKLVQFVLCVIWLNIKRTLSSLVTLFPDLPRGWV